MAERSGIALAIALVAACGGATNKGPENAEAPTGTLATPLPTSVEDPNVPDVKPTDLGALTPGNCDPHQFLTAAPGAPQCTMLKPKSAEATGGATREAAKLADEDACTVWSSGGMPPAYVLIDLGSDQTVSGLLLVPELTPPEVDMANVIEIADSKTSLHEVAELKGHMIDEHGMIAMLPKPMTARYVRITTLGSPAWVSWREVAAIHCGP